MASKLDPEILKRYYAQTFQINPRDQLRSVDDAIDFVNARGFVFLWPVKISRLFRWKIDVVKQALEDLENAAMAFPVEDGRWATSKLG